MNKVAVKLGIAVIKIYKFCISPYVARSCKYTPTCSEYAIEAMEKFGFFRGVTLSCWRILRCNPFSRGGLDPITK